MILNTSTLHRTQSKRFKPFTHLFILHPLSFYRFSTLVLLALWTTGETWKTTCVKIYDDIPPCRFFFINDYGPEKCTQVYDRKLNIERLLLSSPTEISSALSSIPQTKWKNRGALWLAGISNITFALYNLYLSDGKFLSYDGEILSAGTQRENHRVVLWLTWRMQL